MVSRAALRDRAEETSEQASEDYVSAQQTLAARPGDVTALPRIREI